MKVWDKISYFGCDKESALPEQRTVVFVNRIAAILGFFVLSSIIINLALGSYFFIPALSVALLALGSIYLLNHKRLHLAAKSILMLLSLALLFYMCIQAGMGAGLEFYFISLTALPVLIFKSTRTIIFFQALCILFLIGQKVVIDMTLPEDPSRELEYKVFYIVNSIYGSLLVILAIFFFRSIIRKRERQLEELNSAISGKNTQLQEANRDMDAFTYSVSHDLRAPLRAINGFSQLLQQKHAEQLGDDANELLELIRGNASQMSSLIEDLLMLSRVSKHALKLEQVNMEGLVQDVASQFKIDMQSNNAKLTIGHLPAVMADASLMRQVWVNLLSNAVKYSSKKPNPNIEIGAIEQDGKEVYYIRDNGIGFDMKQAQRMFEPFQRLHADNDYSGTGVGLAIVKNIIKSHGGRVWAESKEGEGSTFYFTLSSAD